MNDENTGEIALHQPDHSFQLEVRMENATTRAQIAALFGTKRQAITKHLNSILYFPRDGFVHCTCPCGTI
jgi:hypothetical protein